MTTDEGAGRVIDDRLRQLLIEQGFLHSHDGHILRSRSGSSMPWMFYSPAVALSNEGLTLMASALLDRLQGFRSTQLASYGVSALPLLGACVAAGAGRYTGLIVRREAKPYGARRQIDGPLDRKSPVVLIDDAISSGTAIRDGIQAVEAAGLVVEGVVAIVDFAAGVVEWLSAAGYRVATVFDVWRDLEMSNEPAPAPVESTAPGRSDRLPDGLPAAEVAKRVAHCYRSCGLIPRPPAQLDVEYPYTGGVFVSVRRRSDGIRLVRTGLSAPRAAEASSLADAVVWAACQACRSDAVAAVRDLTDVKFASRCLVRLNPFSHATSTLASRGRLREPWVISASLDSRCQIRRTTTTRSSNCVTRNGHFGAPNRLTCSAKPYIVR